MLKTMVFLLIGLTQANFTIYNDNDNNDYNNTYGYFDTYDEIIDYIQPYGKLSIPMIYFLFIRIM